LNERKVPEKRHPGKKKGQIGKRDELGSGSIRLTKKRKSRKVQSGGKGLVLRTHPHKEICPRVGFGHWKNHPVKKKKTGGGTAKRVGRLITKEKINALVGKQEGKERASILGGHSKRRHPKKRGLRAE